MPKLTLEDKRRETLRRQLYGKEVSVSLSPSKKSDNSQSKRSSINLPSSSSTTFLAKDLTKVLIFSTLAITLQLSLYFLLQNNLVKLPI